MRLKLECQLVEDRLLKYHPYTVAFREPGSKRYLDFSPLDGRDRQACQQAAAELKWPGDRPALVENLTTHLSRFAPPPPVLENVRHLARDNTVCVVTGHQPALFGGPLFLALKVITAIRACEELNRTGDTRFVPVYWNGSEEHNRAEFGRATLFDREHDQVHLALPPDGKRRMAAMTPAEEARTLLAELAKLLPQTEYVPDLLQSVSNCVTGDLGEVQTRLFLRWFGQLGLVVVEPRWFREAAVPVLEKAMQDPAGMHEELKTDTAEVQQMGYAPQLSLHEAERTTVFYIIDGERFRIRSHNNGYALERRDRCFTATEIFDELRHHPERFSPSAALRPIVQAHVLPVAMYVAGGGELAYHVQLRRAFTHFGKKLPLILPRAAGTLIKGSLLKTVTRLQLSLDDLVAPGWEWSSVSAAAEERGAGQRGAFDRFRQHFGCAFTHLETELRDAGLTNLNDLTRERDRFLGRLEGAENRFRQQDPTVGEGPRRQYFRLRKFILPGETYQELSAWSIYFQALYGEDLLQQMAAHIAPFTHQHHLITVS